MQKQHKMKKLFSIIVLITASLCAFSQAKKPTLMVIPSDDWCNRYGFIKQIDVDGETRTLPDYEAAFMKNGDLKIAITTLGTLMQERGFPLKDMEQMVKSINQTSAENMMTTSKSGGGVFVSPLDRIKNRAKCDIILELSWSENSQGPRKSVVCNLRALDAYTNTQIGGMSGESTPTMTGGLAMMLKSAMVGGIDNLNNGLMDYFTKMSESGREVALNINIFEDSGLTLEDEVKGEVLTDMIENWVADNTVNGVYNLADATESMMQFDQVRIPLYDKNERALDTRRWARGLARHLQSKGVGTKLTMQGLGKATVIITGTE